MLLNTSRNIAKMSAAGSGKTYDICKEALEVAKKGKKVLITTYTHRGEEAIKNELRKQNDGVVDQLVIIKTWYSFMMSDLIRPYQRYLTGEIAGVKSYDFSQTYGFINYAKNGTKEKYITNCKNVRSNEASSLVILLNSLSDGKVIKRIEEIYDTIYFDEIQDLTGDDIEIIKLLIYSNVSVVCCGDNKQATFCTHNSKKNKKKTGKNIWSFFEVLENSGIVTLEQNLKSRRFNNQICSFANNLFPIGKPVTSIMNDYTGHDGVFLINNLDIDVYQKFYSAQVLRYDKKTDAYGYHAINFGACKGETFERIIIIPNGPLKKYITDGVALSSPEKYYVAVTRAMYSVAIVMDVFPNNLNGYKQVSITCGDSEIYGLKYIT